MKTENNNFLNEVIKSTSVEKEKAKDPEKKFESNIEKETEKEIRKFEANATSLQKDIENFGGDDKLKEALQENPTIAKRYVDKMEVFIAGLFAVLPTATAALMIEHIGNVPKEIHAAVYWTAGCMLAFGTFGVFKFLQEIRGEVFE